MTNNDLNQISALIDKKLTATENRLKKEISSTEEKLKTEISLVEERLDKKIAATKEELLASDKSITTDIGNFMEETLLPMLNERLDEKADKSDIDRIERKLDRILDTNFDHEHRIKDIESVPIIAHELKRSS